MDVFQIVTAREYTAVAESEPSFPALADGQYSEHCVFGIGDTTSSVLLLGFAASVAKTFGAAKLP